MAMNGALEQEKKLAHHNYDNYSRSYGMSDTAPALPSSTADAIGDRLDARRIRLEHTLSLSGDTHETTHIDRRRRIRWYVERTECCSPARHAWPHGRRGRRPGTPGRIAYSPTLL
ncbi:hypothetical protein D9M68_867740 [compost metagenome]